MLETELERERVGRGEERLGEREWESVWEREGMKQLRKRRLSVEIQRACGGGDGGYGGTKKRDTSTKERENVCETRHPRNLIFF